MANNNNAFVDENQLMDIELPLAPGVDWVGMAQWLGLMTLAIVVVLLLFWLVTHYWLSVRVQLELRRHLRRLLKVADVKQVQLASVRAYQLWVLAQRRRLVEQQAQTVLTPKINQACFGKEVVSRETLITFLQQFDQALAQNRPKLTDILIAGYQRIGTWLNHRKERENV